MQLKRSIAVGKINDSWKIPNKVSKKAVKYEQLIKSLKNAYFLSAVIGRWRSGGAREHYRMMRFDWSRQEPIK